MPMPCRATARRAPFIIVNITRMPWCSPPTRKPCASSKLSVQVAEALRPILCSMLPQVMPFRGPSVPSALIVNFGTRKTLKPPVPGGASGVRASTRCRMFSVRSCSPAEMKHFAPFNAKTSSPRGVAWVRMSPRSVPHCGSVRHMVPLQRPSTRGGSQAFLCASLA